MTLIKPYTFVAGKKARADEVNTDFDKLYEQVNINISNIENLDRDIQEFSSGKADINGSSTERFAVADPMSAGDAMNKQTFEHMVLNTVDYIGGLTITKDSGSPANTIIVEAGACYDSTKKTILQLQNRLSKKNTTQSASTTYYVYIIGDNAGSLGSIDILISTQSGSPTLPSGATKFRRLGYYKTNSSNTIDTITLDGKTNLPASSVYAHAAMPDYGNYETLTNNTTYTASVDGWLSIQTESSDDKGNFSVVVTHNGQTWTFQSCGETTASEHFFYHITIPIPKGAKYRLNAGNYSFQHRKFFHCIGG